jgi:uncharacterized protein with GYD domain
MSIYATLVKFTSQEITGMSHARKALGACPGLAHELGIKLIDSYVMLGPYDIMLIYEAGDEKLSAMLAMNFTSKWGGRSETWTLITKEEFEKLPDKSRGLT